MEQNVREKEKKMAEEQELTKRKTELGESISSCAAEEKKVSMPTHSLAYDGLSCAEH